MSTKVKKAKFKVHGYLIDLLNWFKLPGKRKKWMMEGNSNFDTSDPLVALVKRLHPGLIPAKIIKITEETPSTLTFTLEPEKGFQLPLFYAGQYVSVKFVIDNKTVTRPFAISSAPMIAYQENKLDITLKKKPDGYVCDYVWKNWKLGTQVVFDSPFGHIYYHGVRDAKHVVGITGGSGITIFKSIAEDMLNGTGRPDTLTLLYGSQKANDIIFKGKLDELVKNSNGRIKVIHILSKPDTNWKGETGFINADLIKRLIPDYQTASFYVSGPAALYDFINDEFKKLQISPTRKRLEAYGESTDITKHALYPKNQIGKTYKLTVRFGQESKVILAASTETIVVALERAGLAIDTQCRSGECGWCRSKLEEGTVWQRPEGDGVRSRDRDVGYFHPCSAYPTSDLTVRVFTRI